MSPFLLFIEHAIQVWSEASQATVLLMQRSWQVPLFKNDILKMSGYCSFPSSSGISESEESEVERGGHQRHLGR